MTDPIEIKKVEEGIRIGDTILSQITDTGKVEGNNNVFIQGINNSDVTVRIEIPQTIFDLYFDLICEFIDKSSKSSFYGGTHYHYSRTEDDDYQKIILGYKKDIGSLKKKLESAEAEKQNSINQLTEMMQKEKENNSKIEALEDSVKFYKEI